MVRVLKTGSKATKARARKTNAPKGRKSAKTKRGRGIVSSVTSHQAPSVANLQAQLERRTTELDRALERQRATADILKVIARSPSNVQPVFEAIAESARRLLGSYHAIVTRVIDDTVHLAAFTAGDEEGDKTLQSRFPMPLSGPGPNSRAARTGEIERVTDTETYLESSEDFKKSARARGFRSVLVVPMLLNGVAIGTIATSRRQPGSFADKEIELLRTFADQAVIAVENARLFNETREALAHQTATSEVLQTIGSSMADAQPVFERILDITRTLFGSELLAIFLAPGDGLLHMAASRGENADSFKDVYPMPIELTAAGVTIKERQQKYFADAKNGIGSPPSLVRAAQVIGNFSIVVTPMMWKGRAIGTITVAREPNARFSDKELSLLRTFADQAVIAIENARLFHEVQAKTRGLEESLQQQTATADVLKVISRSAFDLQTVLDTLVNSAARLCEADHGIIVRPSDQKHRVAASRGLTPEKRAYLEARQFAPGDNSATGLALLEARIVHIKDVFADSGYMLAGDSDPARTRLAVPLLREGKPIGVFTLTRQQVNPFTDKQIGLVQTFADQAVIAIENARLFEEVQSRTRDLQESLQQQTATSDVLKVIASSPTEVGPVLQAIVESACQLCESDDATVALKDGPDLVFKAQHGSIPIVWDRLPINRQMVTGRAVIDGQPIHVRDLYGPEGEGFPNAREYARRTDVRTVLSVPLLREGESIGVITLRRTEVEPFGDKQIALLQTFADQAVIAIGNVRLFDEVQAKTHDLTEALTYQTGSANILRVIASSPTDVVPVLQAIVESACELCGAYDALVRLKDGDALAFGAHHGPLPVSLTSVPISPSSTAGMAVIERRPVHIHDLLSADGDRFPHAQELARQLGERTILSVPLLRESESIGAIVIRRREVNPFSDKQIALLQTFADQAVIAIDNARLFEEVQARTRQLAKSLDDLRTAQDRLIQTEKLASLGQLTAGIAHEIKNPLNFINNFSALSVELTDELNDVLKQATLADKIRAEVDQLTSLLKDNLDKVVQHGKRADSIVKNMLVHSREGPGERRSTDINGLVRESLNLAYHGARAETAGFSITLKQDFDSEVGAADLYPQEITRALLNLISNGFYAATRRKVELGSEPFEPVLSATTRNLGETVQIRIRDNGTGIPPDVREKIFNPFFTTKPTGEGTGLGLSMTHEIIVKQHGGRIDVETEPGVFSEFIITLPRDGSAPGLKPE